MIHHSVLVALFLSHGYEETERRKFREDLFYSWGFPGGSMVNNPPANARDRVPFLGQEDPLEKEMATCSSILAWEIPWREEPGGLQSMGSQKSQTQQLNNNNSCFSYAFIYS